MKIYKEFEASRARPGAYLGTQLGPAGFPKSTKNRPLAPKEAPETVFYRFFLASWVFITFELDFSLTFVEKTIKKSTHFFKAAHIFFNAAIA